MSARWKKWILVLLVGASLLILIWWFMLAPPKPRPRPPEPDSIGGVIWCDENQDGFINDRETGVAGVSVKLISAGLSPVVATTEPDTDGYEGAFMFRSLSPGTYSLEVDETRLPASLTPVNRTVPSSWPLSPILTSAGASATGVNAGYVPNSQGCP